MAGRAIQFITEKNGVFQITDESVEFLSKIDPPFAVIAVCGPYRSGKSYLLNRFLGKQRGFGVGSTVNPETRGIYLWNEVVHIVRHDSKEVIPAIIMDTEGISSVQQDKNHDVKIFSLSLLICDYLVYNTMGVIDEKAIETLSLISEVAKYLAVKVDKQNKLDRFSEAEFFPCFAWVLRDFMLDLKDEKGRDMTPNQYLERALQDSKEDQVDKNKIRQALRKYFEVRDCFCLVRPTPDDKDLRHIDDTPSERLRPQFLEGVESLMRTVSSQLPVKKLFRTPMNGEMLVTLIKSYVEGINSGITPKIMDTWKGVATIENGKILRKHIENAQMELKNQTERFPMDPEEFSQFNTELLKYSRNFLQVNLLGDEIQEYLLEFDTAMDSIYRECCHANLNSSLKVCETSFNTVYGEYIVQPLRQRRLKSPKDLVEAWEKFFTNYEEKAKGSAKSIIIANLFPKKSCESFLEFCSQVDEHFKTVLEENKIHEEQLKSEIRSLERQNSESVLQSTKLSGEVQRFTQEIQRLNETITRLEKEKRDLISIHEELRESVKNLQNEIQNKNSSIHDSQVNISTLKSQLELLQSKYSFLETEKQKILIDLSTYEMKTTQKDKQMEELNISRKTQKKELTEHITSLQNQLRDISTIRDQLQSQLRDVMNTRDKLQNQLREVINSREDLQNKLSGEVEQLKNTSDKVKNYQQQEQAMRIEINQYKQDFERSRTELEKNRKEILSLTQEMDQKQLLYEELKINLREQERAKQNIELQLSQLLEEKQHLTEKLTKVSKERDHYQYQLELSAEGQTSEKTRNLQLMQEIETCKQQLIEKSTQYENLMGNFLRKTTELQDLNTERDLAHRNILQLKDEELDALRKDKETFKMDIFNQNIRISETNEELTRTKNHIESLQSELVSANENYLSSQKRLSLLQSELDNLESTFNQNKESSEMKKQFYEEQFNFQKQQLENTLQQQRYELDLQLNEKTQENQRLKESIIQLEDNTAKLNIEIQKLIEEKSRKDQQFKEEHKELSGKYKKEKENLEKQIDLLKKQNISQKEHIENLENKDKKPKEKADIDVNKKKLSEMEKENTQLLKRLENLNYKVTQLEESVTQKDKDIIVWKKTLEKEKKDFVELEKQLEKQKKKKPIVDDNESARRDAMIKELEKRNKLLNTQLEELEEKLKEERGRKETREKKSSSSSASPPVKRRRKTITDDNERNPEELTIADIKKIFTRHNKENLLPSTSKSKATYVELYKKHILGKG